MKNTQLVFLLLVAIYSSAQMDEKYNFGFESQRDESELSDGWFRWGNYHLSIDRVSFSGQRAGKITADPAGSTFGSIAYRIPANYAGKSIQLTGYMKIKDVDNGFAGLLLRIDGNGGSLAFDNMNRQQISGTIDWKKYTINLKYPEGAETIYVAGLLAGSGEAWFDDFTLEIDGKNIQTLQEKEKPTFKADLDQEYRAGSFVKISELTNKLAINLELLGRIWGFLKYHHPEIGKGNFNWDYELFRFLPRYLAVQQDIDRNKLISTWIDDLGEVKTCETCIPTDTAAFLKPDMRWMDAGQLDDDLLKKLRHIYLNRHQGDHYYIAMAPNVGNPIFKNEDAYPNMSYPDQGFRLLSLFRYWNMIYYYFPYKHLMDKDWNKALGSYIPTFISAPDELAYELAVIQLIADIQDTHANIWSGGNQIETWQGKYYPPVHARYIEDQLVVAEFYNDDLVSTTHLKIGDVITTINGTQVQDLIKEKERYYPASNMPTKLRDMAKNLLRSDTSQVEIQYISESGGEQKEMLELFPRSSLNLSQWYKGNDIISFKFIEHDIGYITLKSLKDQEISLVKEQFKDTKALIIDIRNYPAAFVPFTLGSFFVSSPTPFVKFTSANADHPGEFSYGKPLEIPNSEKTYEGKLVVLVNELTQSAAEYAAMAFRAGDNTTIIGSTTAAADGNVSTIFLPGRLRTMISGIGVYYPDGRETQRVGIVPDIEVHPTIEGIRNGRDELLEKALAIIQSE